jgi:hypothetical protein
MIVFPVRRGPDSTPQRQRRAGIGASRQVRNETSSLTRSCWRFTPTLRNTDLSWDRAAQRKRAKKLRSSDCREVWVFSKSDFKWLRAVCSLIPRLNARLASE